jgi:hypothetical protein
MHAACCNSTATRSFLIRPADGRLHHPGSARCRGYRETKCACSHAPNLHEKEIGAANRARMLAYRHASRTPVSACLNPGGIRDVGAHPGACRARKPPTNMPSAYDQTGHLMQDAVPEHRCIQEHMQQQSPAGHCQSVLLQQALPLGSETLAANRFLVAIHLVASLDTIGHITPTPPGTPQPLMERRLPAPPSSAWPCRTSSQGPAASAAASCPRRTGR